MNSGQKLLKIAKKIIPGGNQLLSKRSEIFLVSQGSCEIKRALKDPEQKLQKICNYDVG